MKHITRNKATLIGCVINNFYGKILEKPDGNLGLHSSVMITYAAMGKKLWIKQQGIAFRFLKKLIKFKLGDAGSKLSWRRALE